jgi:hypothetical protein
MPILSSLIRESAASTRCLTGFYELKEEVNQPYNTMRHFQSRRPGGDQAPPRARVATIVDNKLPIGHPGRPPKYDPALCPRARKLALLGMTDAEIAEQFAIHPDTLSAWKKGHPEFFEAIESGKGAG